MKVLYLITKSNWGGAQRHVYDLAVAMKKRGHEVSVALGGDGILRTRLEDAGIFTHSISSLGRDISTAKDAGSLKEIFAIIRHCRPDILHLHSPKAAGLGAFAGRILRVPSIIYTVHGWTFNESRPLHQRALIALFSWLTIILSHKVVLLSEWEYSQTVRFPWVAHKLKLIPLGVTPPTFISVDGARTALARLINIEPASMSKKMIIGTIAELHPNKGLGYLVEAMSVISRQHPQVICLIIGDGQDKDKLRSLIDEHGLGDRVMLVGYLEHASDYLKAFSFFVLPSIKEGLPYTVLEAGCASLPVVATTVGGIPEIIDDMTSGILIPPKNPRELSHAISFLIEHPTERKKYGAALRERVLSKFSLEKMLTAIDSLYTSKI